MNALKEIREREANYKGANVTRYYNQVIPTRNGECRIDTYAVKTRNKRTGELAIKKVARYYSDRQRYYVRDVIYNNFMHYYTVSKPTDAIDEPYIGEMFHAALVKQGVVASLEAYPVLVVDRRKRIVAEIPTRK